MRLLIISSCSASKSGQSVASAQALPIGSQAAVSRAWQRNIASVAPADRCDVVYRGRGVRIAHAVAETFDADFAVVSAGLGYVPGSVNIPVYDLTLQRGSASSIAARVRGAFSARDWWNDVKSGPYSANVERDVEARPLVLAAVSRMYLGAIVPELRALADRGTVRMFGLNIARWLPEDLAGCALPYDERLDAVGGGGTLLDFAPRALRHYMSVIYPISGGSLAEDIRLVKEMLIPVEAKRRQEKHTRASDEELHAIIRRVYAVNPMAQSKMLAHLRHSENIACEQARFRTLYAEALEETGNAVR